MHSIINEASRNHVKTEILISVDKKLPQSKKAFSSDISMLEANRSRSLFFIAILNKSSINSFINEHHLVK